MSTAKSTPEAAPASIPDRPVRASIGFLYQDRSRLLELSEAAGKIVEGLKQTTTDPYELLSAGVAKLASPSDLSVRNATFEVQTDPGPDSKFYYYQVFANRFEMTPTAPAPFKERLLDAASSALGASNTSDYSAAHHFRALEKETNRDPGHLKELFRAHVSENGLMPVHHRERTLAIAHAHAAVTVHHYAPTFDTRQELTLVDVHADRSRKSFAEYCGIDPGISPERDPGITGACHRRMLLDAIGINCEANDLGAKVAKRYGLLIAQDLLASR